MSDLLLKAITTAIRKEGKAEVRCDWLAMAIGTDGDDDEARSEAIDSWLAANDLAAVARPFPEQGPKAKVTIVPERSG